jgi:hypothetical protein
MGRQYVSSHLDDDDEVRLHHNPERPDNYGGTIPEAVHVHLGDSIVLWGPPALVAAKLDEALTRVQAVIDGKED